MFSDRRIRTSLVAIATDLFLTALKVLLAIVTGSAALKADAFHSATDLIVSLVLLIGIFVRIRQEKSTEDSNSGIGELIESALAIFVAVIILYVPYEIISEIGREDTKEINHLAIGIFGTTAVILIVLFISRFKLFVGRETQSIALEADGYHSMVDVFTSIAVLVSLLGYMVGINLDEIVAVVIAIMIGVTGLELLISGIKSLIKKTAVDQVSFYELVADVYRKIFVRYSISNHVYLFSGRLYRYRLFFISLGIIIYFLSGFRIITEGYIGKKYQLGAVDEVALKPGLHYALPWPFGKITSFEDGSVYAVSLGTRSEELALGTQRIWAEIKEKSLHEETTNYYITADKQLLDMSISVFYRVLDADGAANSINFHESLVTQISSYSLNHFILSHSLDNLLLGDRVTLKNILAENIQNNLDNTLQLFEIVDVQFQTYRLPALVIGAYRDVINAQQEKLQGINRAIADRSKALPLSRAAYKESLSQAESNWSTKMLEAEGNITRITALSQIQKSSSDAFEFNEYLKMVEDALTEKEIVIRDGRLSNSDLRLWNYSVK